MQELVRLAEVREAQAKEQMTALLSSRSNMFQSQQATSEADADLGGTEQQIEEAQRTKALAKKKFNKARSVCIGAHQVQAMACAVSHAVGSAQFCSTGFVRCITKAFNLLLCCQCWHASGTWLDKAQPRLQSMQLLRVHVIKAT